jgi:hypothetical protein
MTEKSDRGFRSRHARRSLPKEGWTPRDEGAPADLSANQAPLGKEIHRRSHRGNADPQALRQLADGRNSITGSQSSLRDSFLYKAR